MYRRTSSSWPDVNGFAAVAQLPDVVAPVSVELVGAGVESEH